MYKKITITLAFLSVVVLFYFAYQYYLVQDYKLIANEKINYLNKAAYKFCTYGFIVCATNWLWVNVVAIKIKQFVWLWLPFSFTAFVAWLISYHAEDIFMFNKENGLWKGGFSVSYFAGGIIILIAAVVLLLNYFVLKMIIKKNASKN
jgi:hypothetical protein